MQKTFLAVLALLLCPGSASAQGQARTFTVPFHSIGAMILLDASVNGKPAVLLLDTGSNVSFLDVHLSRIRFKAEKVRRVGMSGCVVDHAHVTAGGLDLPDQRLCVADLSDISKSIKAHVDAFIGQDLLRDFSAVRIDFKSAFVEFEQ